MEENKFYVYRHIRLDKNVPFYIGIGSKPKKYDTYQQEYKRAFRKDGRSKHWYRIVEKHGYKVEILFEDSSYELIKQKEVEFIKLYGRQDLGTGILVNHTDGGDGIFNMSNETRAKISEASKKLLSTEEAKRKASVFFKQMWNNPEFKAKMRLKKKGVKKSEMGRNKIKLGKRELNGTLCVDLDTGIYYNSIIDACEALCLNYNTIRNRINKGIPCRIFRVNDKKEINDNQIKSN